LHMFLFSLIDLLMKYFFCFMIFLCIFCLFKIILSMIIISGVKRNHYLFAYQNVIVDSFGFGKLSHSISFF
uniref:Ovule protein n=1 Tax=Brugia timori TaxID=42155 RepID=A0A0R3R9Q2_9BILA